MTTTLTRSIVITGNTYPVKEQLKAMGGTWNATAKGWNIPEERADEARALVEAAPAGYIPRQPRPQRSRYGSNYARFTGGGEWYQNKRGRCEDAPCCGCCS